MTPQIKQRIEQIRRGEVPEGYKKTKAGVIPSEWDLHPLSKHLTESRISGTNGAIAKKLTVKLWNKGVFAKREVHEGSESTTYYKRKAGQLIYSKLDFLNCAFGIIPDHLNGYESTQDLPCFDINDVDPYYLLTYVTQRNFYTHFGMIADGGRKARRVGPEDMLSFPLIYPSLDEQKKIAEILSAQDNLIALKEKLIEEKKRQKKYLMQLLLTGKKRLPGFSGEWEKKKIKDICIDVITGNTPSKKDEALWNGKFPWITSQDFCGKYINQSSVTLSPMGKEQCRVVPAKSVLITCIASIGLNAITNIECATNQQINAIVCTSEEMAEYVYYYMELHEETMKRLAGKTAVPIINKSQFENFPIIFPHDNAEMKKIVECLSAYDKEIELLDMKLNQEKQKKKALMQLLLTGIVRV